MYIPIRSYYYVRGISVCILNLPNHQQSSLCYDPQDHTLCILRREAPDLTFVLGQTNKNQSERLNCPEAPGARMIIADVLKHPPPYYSGSRGVWGAIAAVLRRAPPYYSGSRGVWAGYSGCFEARASLL